MASEAQFRCPVKPFDVPIEWVAKYSCVGAVCNGFPSNLTAHSSLMKAIFWQTEDMHGARDIFYFTSHQSEALAQNE